MEVNRREGREKKEEEGWKNVGRRSRTRGDGLREERRSWSNRTETEG